MKRSIQTLIGIAAIAGAASAAAIEADVDAIGIESVELYVVATATFAAGDLKFVVKDPFELPLGFSCNGNRRTFIIKGDAAGKRARQLFQNAMHTRHMVQFRISQPSTGPCVVVAGGLYTP